jgi:hypothetical protein
MSFYRCISYFAVGAGGFVLAWLIGMGNRNGSLSGPDTFRDFLRVQAYDWNNDYRSGIKPAERLPNLPNSEIWTVLYLLDRNATRYALDDVSAAEFEETFAAEMGKMDRGKLAVMLQNMPAVPDKAVLWALTTLLEEKGIGWYSETTLLKHSDCVSSPIRELAHDILCRSLGVDHGYQISKWRKEIVDHARRARLLW